jgi:hypothetical protein
MQTAALSALSESMTWDSTAAYFLWALANLLIPVGLPVFVLWLIDRTSSNSTGAKLISDATKDGQLLCTMAISAVSFHDIADAEHLQVAVKLLSLVILGTIFLAALVWVVWWTVSLHAKPTSGANPQQGLTANEAALISGSKWLIVSSVVVFAALKPFL